MTVPVSGVATWQELLGTNLGRERQRIVKSGVEGGGVRIVTWTARKRAVGVWRGTDRLENFLGSSNPAAWVRAASVGFHGSQPNLPEEVCHVEEICTCYPVTHRYRCLQHRTAFGREAGELQGEWIGVHQRN